MIFEFLIACNATPEQGVASVSRYLLEVLTNALDASGSNDDEVIIQNRVVRAVDNAESGNGNTLLGFDLDLPEHIMGVDVVDEVLTYFVDNLRDNDTVFHVVMFEDPLLRAELSALADEIFRLEMKLRRALSLIYLNANELRDPFDLLAVEKVQKSRASKVSQMRRANENQFFHLDFGKYKNLNQRSGTDLTNRLQEEDASFIAGIGDDMKIIERMRNCVAHNRRPPQETRDSYPSARDHLDELLNEYLSRWEERG